MGHKDNLLFISSHFPSSKVPQAGQKIAENILEEYSKKYNVYLISFYNEVEEKYINESRTELFKYIYFTKVTIIDRLLSVFSHMLLPIKASVRANSKVKKKFIELQGEVKFNLIHFEFTSAAYYMKYVKQNVKKVITEHDVTYQALERKMAKANLFARFFYYFEYLRQKKWELDVLRKADEIIVLNNKDKQILLNDGISPDKININTPNINLALKKISRENIEKYSILFWGAMNRKENTDGIRWFIHKIFPLVLKQCERAKLYIVGANPADEIKKMHSHNIIVTGFVQDPIPYFEKCQIAIAPLRIGAGIKIKVLEYLEAGLTVISTPVGAEGISHKHLFITDNEDKFANMILDQFGLK